MSINVNILPYFWEEPKIESLIERVGISKGEARIIYLQCIHVMTQGLVDYITHSKLTLIVYENLHRAVGPARNVQKTARLVACLLIEIGLFFEEENDNSTSILRCPGMSKRMPKLLESVEQRRLAGKKSGEARKKQSNEPLTGRSTNRQRGVELSNLNLTHTEKIKTTSSSDSSAAIVEIWNDHSGLSPVLKLTESRKRKIKARLKNHPSLDAWRETVTLISESPFLRGEKGKWKATFDWLIGNEDNWVKIHEGQYADGVATDRSHLQETPD